MTTTSKTTRLHKRLALCGHITLDVTARWWVPVNTHGTPWVAQDFTSDYKPPTRLKHLHGGGASSLKPQICEAATELGDKIRHGDGPETETFRTQPRATETSIPQEVRTEIQQEIP